jgi:hypothetical protein
VHYDHWLPRAGISRAASPTLEVTIEIIVDKESYAAADRARHWKHGRLTDILSIY